MTPIPETFEELCEWHAYCVKEKATEREKAKTEFHIWQKMPIEKRRLAKGHGLPKTLAPVLNVSAYELAHRNTIWLAGEDDDQLPTASLWDRLEKDLPLHAAVSILQMAKSRARNGGGNDLTSEIELSLLAYDRNPVLRVSSNGKSSRKISLGSSREDQSRDAFNDKLPVWTKIRRVVGEYVDSRLEGMDDYAASLLKKEIEADFRILIDDIQSRVSRVSTNAKSNVNELRQSVSRIALVNACEILGVDAPNFGEPADLKEAGIHRKRLGRAYHPDSNGGSNSTVVQFRAVIDAYRTLETYNEALSGGNNDGDRDHP